MLKGKELIKKKFKKKPIIICGLLFVAAAVLFMLSTKPSSTAGTDVQVQNTAVAEKRSIVSELSSSGTVLPKDTYSITSLAEGEVIQAEFEEGDQVEKGQVLYQIDVSSMESQLQSAENSLERSQSSYDLAVSDYNDAVNNYSGNTYKSTETGYIKTLYVRSGDKISANTKIADIYDDKSMKLKVPFLSSEAVNIGIGNEAVVTLTDTLEQLPGLVTAVSSMDETLSGGRLIRYVTIQVANPGGLTSNIMATAAIGSYYCSVEGTFAPMVDTIMNADLPSNVDVETMLVSEGDYISKGMPVFQMNSKSADKLLRSYQDAKDKAQESLETARNNLETTQDNYGNYTITAPISGQVITKSVKQGDNIAKNTGSTTTLAIIYDLSSATFEMSVDELDVRKVKVGQSVEVTADAVEGVTYTGKVTNISLESVNSNGVTNYPVTVSLDEVGDLLPGMNVDARIILDQADDVLTITVDALMRGSRVYVKDETAKEAEGAVPAGFRAVDVETGLTNEDYVEIISGLNENDVVYVAKSTVNKNSSQMIQMAMPAGGSPSGGGSSGGSRGSGSGNR